MARKKRIKLGTYQIGYRIVDVFMDEDLPGGQCRLCIGDGKCSQIIIGTNEGKYKAWDYLVHEAFELSMADNDCCLTRTGMTKGLNQYFTFVMTHEEFTRVAIGAGWLLEEVWNDFWNFFKEMEQDAGSKTECQDQDGKETEGKQCQCEK